MYTEFETTPLLFHDNDDFESNINNYYANDVVLTIKGKSMDCYICLNETSYKLIHKDTTETPVCAKCCTQYFDE